jgi:hypothetical protein
LNAELPNDERFNGKTIVLSDVDVKTSSSIIDKPFGSETDSSNLKPENVPLSNFSNGHELSNTTLSSLLQLLKLSEPKYESFTGNEIDDIIVPENE